jgi:xanthine dehydrogenase accessory factor
MAAMKSSRRALDAIYERLIELERGAGEGILVTVVETSGSGPAGAHGKMLVTGDAAPLGTVGGGNLEHLAIQRAGECLAGAAGGLETFDVGQGDAEATATGMICGGTVTLLFERVGTAERLVLFGAGHIGQALARRLAGTGLAIEVVDERPDLLSRVAEATRREARPPESLAGAYVVIATHSHAIDYRVLRDLLAAEELPRYIGLVASRRKRAQFLERLAADLDRPPPRELLYTPAGLDLGGGSPEEIALSIAAEILALRNGRTGHAHLDDYHRSTPVAS